VNWFDSSLISFLNYPAGRSWVLDNAVRAVSSTHLTVEVLLMAYWWVWFHQGSEASKNRTRETVVASLIAVFVAVSLSMLLAPAFPSYGRPIHADALPRLPFGVSPETTHIHAAFPSHHALVAFVLVTGLLIVSRPIGFAAAIYAIALVGVPPVYIGLHYPTDILGGALLGTAVAGVLNMSPVRNLVGGRAVAFATHQPAVFYGLAFMVTLQLATLFDDAVPFAHMLVEMLRGLQPHALAGS